MVKRSSQMSAVTLALAALAPGLHGCAAIAGLEDRKVALVVIASGQEEPQAIALDEQAVYWTNGGNEKNGDEWTGGSLRKQLKGRPAVLDLLAPSDEAPYAIALDATHIYFSSTDTSKEGSCEGTGVERDKLWKLPKDTQLPADGGELLWGSCGAVETIALGAGNVYSARPNAKRITWIPKDGGSRKDLTEEGAEPVGVATDGTLVYWTDRAAKTVSMDDTSDDAPGKPIVEGLEDVPGLLVLDEANLYWLTPDNVLRYPRNGSSGEAPVPLLDAPASPSGLAAHGAYLYVTDAQAGVVHEIRKDGSAPPVLIAKDQAGPTAIAADGTGVYWTNAGSGEIVRFDDD